MKKIFHVEGQDKT